VFKSLPTVYHQHALEPLMAQTDEELLRLLADDNKAAFTVLYRRYWEGLFVTACRVLDGKEEAADVIQDVFLSFWNRRHELNLQGSLAAYLHTSVRYKCIHHTEKNSTRRDYLFLLTEIEIKSFSTNAESNLDLKEIQQAIGETVAKMPPKMQEVYKLSREQQLSYKAIAEYMDISVETVKKHIQHALHLIRRDLHTLSYTLVIAVLFGLH